MRLSAGPKRTIFPHPRISCAGVREGAHCKTTSSRESELVACKVVDLILGLARP
jgi:hypothetical protein